MEHCDCYKKELVELFIQFLQKESLTCTLSVFRTEITSLWGPNAFPSRYWPDNEAAKEAFRKEDSKAKRPRSPVLEENLQPNIFSNVKTIGLSSSRNFSNSSDCFVTESSKRQRLDEGQAEEPEKNSNNVVSFSQAVVKQNSIKHSKPLSHVSKPQSYLPEQRQSSRIIGSNLCQKGGDANHCEKEQKKKVAVESRVRDNSGGLEESIRNVTESLRCDPTFQDNLRNFLRNDNLNTRWFSLPPKNSESLQANSDAALPASETFTTNKSKKEVGWDSSRVIDDAQNRDGCMESSMGGVLDSIDLDAFLDSIHATSNH
ncbi:hypothetical protein GAYE_HPESCF16G0175 [Galdieria yellowstonensis]|uniref:Uncharacterized protein n=1 Tax=Galdieria yellowstonensis TaxID=3028027 RepID=A0AAV9I311_9RHOD|nr:hypothetical protein GAYE_HPESCF16G0175 [Galdieria yellowstonensis]